MFIINKNLSNKKQTKNKVTIKTRNQIIIFNSKFEGFDILFGKSYKSFDSINVVNSMFRNDN